MLTCPGADNFRSPRPQDVRCPSCGAEVEIWSDEAKAICAQCKTVVVRIGGQSCLDWCAYAADCVGKDAYKRYLENKSIARDKAAYRVGAP